MQKKYMHKETVEKHQLDKAPVFITGVFFYQRTIQKNKPLSKGLIFKF